MIFEACCCDEDHEDNRRIDRFLIWMIFDTLN
jgi:hypothetical protein